MLLRTAEARWEGNLREGKGRARLGSGGFDSSNAFDYSFASRFENGSGTNPEELLGAAHASCFSMALSANLVKAGHTPKHVHTIAKVHMEKGAGGFSINQIELFTEAEVPGINQATLEKEAEKAKSSRPISRALGGTEIVLRSVLLVLKNEESKAAG